MPGGVIGNTSDSGSEKSRFDPWPGSIFSIVLNTLPGGTEITDAIVA